MEVETSHLCEEPASLSGKVVCTMNGRAPDMSENSLKTPLSPVLAPKEQPRTLWGDAPEKKALWGKLRIGEPLGERAHCAVGTPSRWAGVSLVTLALHRGDTFSKSGDVTSLGV